MVDRAARVMPSVREGDYFAWLTAFEDAAAAGNFTVTRQSGKNAGKTDVSHNNVVLVAFVLGRHCDGPRRADPGGNIRPGFARLRAVTGLGDSALQKAINVLLRTGWLVQLRGGGKERAAVYALARPRVAVQPVSGHALNDARRCPDTDDSVSGHAGSPCEDTALLRTDPRTPSQQPREPVQSPLVAAMRGGAGVAPHSDDLPHGTGEQGRRLLRLVATSLGDAGVELLTDPRASEIAAALDEVAGVIEDDLVVSVLTDGWPDAGANGRRIVPAGIVLSQPRLGRLQQIADACHAQRAQRTAREEREAADRHAAWRREQREQEQAQAVSAAFGALPDEAKEPWLTAAAKQTVVPPESPTARKMIAITAAQLWGEQALDPPLKEASG